MVITTTPN